MPDNIPPWVRRGCCVECNACYGILVVRELHRASRTYLFQNVLSCGIPSARVQILARFGNFYRGLRKSPSNEVAVLANIVGRDLRSTTGYNLKLLEESSGLSPWIYDSSRLKQELLEKEPVIFADQDLWRIEYLGKLLEHRQRFHYLGEEDKVKHMSELIDSLCIN